jgi:hypothetical protein
MQGRLVEPLTPDAVASESRYFSAFVDSALRWCRSGAESDLARLIRSPLSGVPHDAAAAYATLAARTGPLLDAIERQRLALPAADRDAVLQFAARARRMFARAPDLDDRDLRAEIGATFAIDSSALAPAAAVASRKAGATTVALAEPVDREPGAGVRARQKHFSASSLNAYAECARKWFYRYACSAVEDKGSSASAYGTSFHLALEDFHADFPRPTVADESAMRESIGGYVTWAFERNRDGFATAVEFELQRRRAIRTAQRYVDWLLLAARKAPFEVIGREVPANLDLDGHAFIGFIDRLDRDERSGGVGVVDYKTGSIASSASEYREKVRRFADFQLPFYYWARASAGDRVTTLALLPLKDALLDVRPIVLEVVHGAPTQARRYDDSPTGTISVSDLERARAKMIELSGDLASGSLERFEVTRDPAACTYCAYAMACSRKPAAEQERFGR